MKAREAPVSPGWDCTVQALSVLCSSHHPRGTAPSSWLPPAHLALSCFLSLCLCSVHCLASALVSSTQCLQMHLRSDVLLSPPFATVLFSRILPFTIFPHLICFLLPTAPSALSLPGHWQSHPWGRRTEPDQRGTRSRENQGDSTQCGEWCA